MEPIEERINIVWLKRDLRTQDHAPLLAAEESGLPYMLLFIYEPLLLGRPDWNERHGRFIWQSIESMNRTLGSEKGVQILYGEANSVFEFILKNYQVNQVFSYQETGTQDTFERDKEVATTFKNHGVQWAEFQRDGVIRGIKNRDGWDRQWFATMNQPQISNTYNTARVTIEAEGFELPIALIDAYCSLNEHMQRGGEEHAHNVLQDFLADRGKNYRKHISKPGESHSSCSRLSTYLAWGNMSIKQAYQITRSADAYNLAKGAYSAFLTRLKWHCHFIQKFEVECRYETQFINRGYESMAFNHNESMIVAWESGQTGFPLIDACMRCLQTTGWINFRMRAMLVSFFAHHMGHDWRLGVYHLAQQFLDYEPGIHFTQFQMQAGTTGINTVRIYNPVKQSKDHCPDGSFIRKWIPEIQNIPAHQIHEPWLLTEFEQELYEVKLGRDYPYPILDHMEAARAARSKIWSHKSKPEVKAENGRMLEMHTRKTNRWA